MATFLDARVQHQHQHHHHHHHHHLYDENDNINCLCVQSSPIIFINVTMVKGNPIFHSSKVWWCKYKDSKRGYKRNNPPLGTSKNLRLPSDDGPQKWKGKRQQNQLFSHGQKKVPRFRKTWPKALGMTPRNSSDSSLPTMVCVLPVPVWP